MSDAEFMIEGEATAVGPRFFKEEGVAVVCELEGILQSGTQIDVIRDGMIVFSGELTRFDHLNWRESTGFLQSGLAALIADFELKSGDVIKAAPRV